MEHMGIYETVMAMKRVVMEYAHDNADAHLKRYINNRNKRTGQTWTVIERYYTNGNGKRVDKPHWHWRGWERAIIANEHGEHVRIWHRGTCWCVA